MNKNLYRTYIFRQFAEKKLENHCEKLKTSYQTKVLNSAERRKQAYKKHRKFLKTNWINKLNQ